MTPDQQSHLHELFAAFSQDTMTKEMHQELQAVLLADVEARRLWFLHQDLELGLKCLTQHVKRNADQTGEDALLNSRCADADAGPEIFLPMNITESSPVSWFVRRNLTITTVTLLCLSAIVLFGFQFGMRQPDFNHAVGNKIENNQVVNFHLESPTHGTMLNFPSQNGKLIALHFLLKTECPFCLKLAHDYSQLAITHPDVLHLFLKPDSTDEIKVWAGKISQKGLTNPPVIYRDPDAQLANKFSIPDGYQFHGQTGHYPALVLLDHTGRELFRYVGKNNTDRMKPDDFIARLTMVADDN